MTDDLSLGEQEVDGPSISIRQDDRKSGFERDYQFSFGHLGFEMMDEVI